MKFCPTIHQNGFTLLEVLLSIALLATLSVTGYSAFTQFNQQKNLSLATADFSGILSEAKSDTLNQVNAGTCQPDKTFKGYLVQLNGDSGAYSSYTLKLVCVNSSDQRVYTDVKTSGIPSDVSLGFNKVIIDENNNTILTATTEALFSTPNGALDSSYAASLNNTVGIGIDANGTILQQ
jgi:prepilin-type N-terminal cleavage/methylation domain-containing protein